MPPGHHQQGCCLLCTCPGYQRVSRQELVSQAQVVLAWPLACIHDSKTNDKFVDNTLASAKTVPQFLVKDWILSTHALNVAVCNPGLIRYWMWCSMVFFAVVLVLALVSQTCRTMLLIENPLFPIDRFTTSVILSLLAMTTVAWFCAVSSTKAFNLASIRLCEVYKGLCNFYNMLCD